MRFRGRFCVQRGKQLLNLIRFVTRFTFACLSVEGDIQDETMGHKGEA